MTMPLSRFTPKRPVSLAEFQMGQSNSGFAGPL
jgi:hypothetical protein